MTYNNKDGEVITKKCDKGVIITYIDENDFIKQIRALKMFYMRTYKDLTFNVSYTLKQTDYEDGEYEIPLYTEKTFEKVYGKFILRFFVQNKTIVIKEITPREILIDLHRCLLQTYKGVPYRNQLDLLKIKLLIGE